MTQIGLNGFTLNSSNKKLVIIGITAIFLTVVLTGYDVSYILQNC